MSSGKNRLMLMMALSMPGAAQSLGLGDIHVDSALNERLAAEIDIVGATADELGDLRAAVANRETFLRFGSERPAFLSSATFKVTQDSKGRPVLAVRSTEAFTEPLVNFLVDMTWRKGELVRQYTLLLDPPGFAAPNRLPETIYAAAAASPGAASIPPAPAAPDVPAVPAAAAPILETKSQTVARQADPESDRPNTGAPRADRKMTRIKVGAKATLRGIAWRVGERSASDLQRMMIAIFRANPGAFDGNINRLHLGAVLTIPSYAEVGVISPEEAKREFHAQMGAWHSPVRPMNAGTATPTTSNPVAAATAAAAEAAPAKASEIDALNKRVKSLEHELVETQEVLESQRDKLVDLQQQAAFVEKTPATVAVTSVADTPIADASSLEAPGAEAPLPPANRATLVPFLGGFGLLAGALAALYFRLRRRPSEPNLRVDQGAASGDAMRNQAPAEVLTDPGHDSHAAEDDASVTQDSAAPIYEYTQPMLPIRASDTMPKRVSHAAATLSPTESDDTTVNTRIETVKLPIDPAQAELRVNATRLDYNLLDLDMTAAHHVQMPSVLNEQVIMKERRTNLADVLKLAIEREPDRHDLRMKLLELYYSAAATNRQAFLEVVQKFALDRDYLQADQWDKIVFMGRQIASDNPLFAEAPAADDDLADCA